jgi:p-hydroxybenzoate 3-monooxygenase
VRTQVAIIGAGPAGLTLGRLLEREGIEAVILEARSRDYVEQRIRAGVLEQGTVDLLTDTGLGERLHAEGHAHQGIELRFAGRGHRIPLTDLTGRSIWIYGQQKVVEDLIEGRGPDHGELFFDVDDVSLREVESDSPSVSFRHDDEEYVVHADFVAGCDGFHGICRPTLPAGVLTTYEREYPFAWLGILAEVAPTYDELVYTHHDRGFALLSQRGPTISRMYLQVAPDEDVADWPDERIWAELHGRVDIPGGRTLQEGPIFDKGVTPMRGFVAEPMQHGRLFLAGDAAHIVPPTGAKGLNLAVADVKVLADALAAWYSRRDTAGLDAYSATCLRRVWRAQHFSWWMTSLLHRFGDQDPYESRLQRSQLDYVTSSTAAATSLAENYVGLPLP